MTNYYSNSQQYHDDLDRFEAIARAEREERELDELERAADVEGSVSSMMTHLNDAGFGQGGVL